MQPFLIPDDFRAFMQQVVRTLDAPGEGPGLLDAEDALQHETGYGGRVDGSDLYRFTYISADGRHKWVVQMTEAAIRDISDGLLIEVLGERVDLVRTIDRQPKGHPLLIWGEYADDALVARDHVELLRALDALHALAQAAPRMLRMWTPTDDQIVAMVWRDDCALYVVESLDGYATSCGDHDRTDAFQLVDYDGRRFTVPYHDCVPWSVARNALLRFVERGELGPEIRTEGRIPTGLLMMGDVDRAAALEARAETPRTVARTSIPRMLTPVPDEPDPADAPDAPHPPTLDEPIGPQLERPSDVAILAASDASIEAAVDALVERPSDAALAGAIDGGIDTPLERPSDVSIDTSLDETIATATPIDLQDLEALHEMHEPILPRVSQPSAPAAQPAPAPQPQPPAPAERPLPAEEVSAWARRLIDLLNARALIELGRVNLDELSYQLGGLLQAHGAEAQRSLDTAEWLANEIGAMRGIEKLFATAGDLQIALRRSRTL